MCTKLCYVINPKYFKYKSYNIIINFLKEKKKKKKEIAWHLKKGVLRKEKVKEVWYGK